MSGSISATALATAAITTVGGAVLSKMMAPKVDKPGAPPPVPTVTDTEADKQAKDAQKKQRAAAAAAVGREDTISGMNIGSAASTGNAAAKTLLGM